jgi:hypothetical protein
MRAPSEKPKKKPTPKTHVIEQGEIPPIPITIDNVQEYRVWRVTEHGRHEESFRRHGVGKKRGRPSAELVVCKEAERLLKAGWSAGDKWDFTEHVANWYARHYLRDHPDAPTMSAERLYRNKPFTALWGRRKSLRKKS